MITNLFVILIGTLVLGSCATQNLIDRELVHLHNVAKVDLTKDDITEVDKSIDDICQFGGYFGGLQFTNESVAILANWEVIEFKVKLRAYETVFKVEILNQTESKPNRDGVKQHKFSFTPHLTGKDSQFGIDADFDVRLNQVNITLTEEKRGSIGFAVWDVTVNRKSVIPREQIKTRDDSSLEPWLTADPHSGDQVYLVKSSVTGNRAYMNFTFDDPDSSREYCFWWLSSTETTIEVHLSVFEANQQSNRPLTRFTQLNNVLCLSSYIYVRQLGKFDLSFVFTDHVKHDSVIVNLRSLRIEKKEVNIVKVVPKYENSFSNYGSPVWWYNNPSLFNYTVVGDMQTQLYVCDILANCYPYDRKQINNGTALYNFTLEEKYKQLLSHSPLIRLNCDDPGFMIYRNTSYLSANRIALTRIESHLRTSSPQLQPLNYSGESIISYQMLQVHRQTRIPLSIPIDTIDLRAQSIGINISPLNTSNLVVQIVQVKVNGVNKLNNISHTTTQYVSTSDYIQVEPWKMVNDFKSFEVEFEVMEIKSQNASQLLVDLKINISVHEIDIDQVKQIEKLPKFGNENCLKGPTYADLDCHQTEYQCPEYYFKYDPVTKKCTRTGEPTMHQ